MWTLSIIFAMFCGRCTQDTGKAATLVIKEMKMQFQPYLIFNGNCADAMRYYERVLGAKLEAIMKVGEAPGCSDAGPESKDRIMHARLVLDDSILMASDSMVGQPYEGMKGFSVTLNFPTVEQSKRVFNAFADGGQVIMPMDKTFWVESFGIVVDRFGTSWMINGGKMITT